LHLTNTFLVESIPLGCRTAQKYASISSKPSPLLSSDSELSLGSESSSLLLLLLLPPLAAAALPALFFLRFGGARCAAADSRVLVPLLAVAAERAIVAPARPLADFAREDFGAKDFGAADLPNFEEFGL
jgi:hypothetical protein